MKLSYKKLFALLFVLFAIFISCYIVWSETSLEKKVKEVGNNSKFLDTKESSQNKNRTIEKASPEGENEQVKPRSNHSLKTIAGKQYVLSSDCALDIAGEVYSLIKYDLEGKEWLEIRGYDLFYQNNGLAMYHNYDDESLKSMAENGDAIAMSRIAMNTLFNSDTNDDKKVIEQLEEMLIKTGNFVSLDLLILNLPLTTEGSLETQLNWAAVNQELNGLGLYNNPHLNELIQEKNLVWAKEKIKELNKKRSELGMKPLTQEPLKKSLNKEVEKYMKFKLEQEQNGNTGVGC
ncbi:hypothetical protein [Kangiella spongicola]|uniref:Uncharacterized protein n=1 Tax=Kangiella spongicola TaxID=796379 RepID=A0A318DAI6_9GAMM|nr:hypothetical protein [Kangiella spongicola]PXF63927.1 hypothetical protein DL796_01945 [Kangiella spongicola]